MGIELFFPPARRAAAGAASLYDFYSSKAAFNAGDATADTTALQAWYDSAAPSCLVPPTSVPFLLNATVLPRSNKTLYGLSRTDSILKRADLSADHDFFGINRDGGSTDAIPNNIVFKTLCLHGNRDGQSADDHPGAIFLINASDSSGESFSLEDCRIHNFSRGGQAVSVKGYTGVRELNNDISDGGDGLFHANYFLRCNDGYIAGNTFKDIGSQCVKWSANGLNGNHVDIIANQFYDGHRAINVADAYDATIMANIIKRFDEFGIRCGNEDGTDIFRAIVSYNNIEGALTGITISNGTSFNVKGNLLSDCASRGMKFFQPNGGVISGNRIRNADGTTLDSGGLRQVEFDSVSAAANLISYTGNFHRLATNVGATERVGVYSKFTGNESLKLGIDNIFSAPNNYYTDKVKLVSASMGTFIPEYARGAAIADATDPATTMARLNALLAQLRTNGTIAT